MGIISALNEFPVPELGLATNDIEEGAIRWIGKKKRVGDLFTPFFNFVDINCITQPILLEVVTVAMYKKVLMDIDVSDEWLLDEMRMLGAQFHFSYPINIREMSWHWRALTTSVLICIYIDVAQRRSQPDRLRQLVIVRRLIRRFSVGGALDTPKSEI